MDCVVWLRRGIWLFAPALLMGCSMITGSIPAAMDIFANAGPVVFVPPSNTPFLPDSYTDTPSPTVPPTGTPIPTPTVTDLPTDTGVPTETMTEIVLPSVTPAPPPTARPTLRPTVRQEIPPTATKKPKPPSLPSATATKAIVLPALPTSTQAAGGTAAPSPTQGNPPARSPSPTSAPPTATDSGDPFPGCTYQLNTGFENQIFARINQARAEAGLWDLSWYGPLAAGARYHSLDMGCNRYFAHTGGVYENILAGYNTVEEAWNWWWNSKPHHDNILGQYYYKVGVGYANVPGSPYRYYWTIQFSR
jgi:uncharacterized protein YkwD